MRTILNTQITSSYKSNSQKIRVSTEDWVSTSKIFCPNCGNDISKFKDNQPVADFYCASCKEEYELKSKKDSIGKKIVDGAYSTMIDRLQSQNNPNFFFLNYDSKSYKILNFLVIPKYFFVPKMIEKRKPLSQKARRAGWIGCNILLRDIPRSGKIFYIKDGQVVPKKNVLENWTKTLFLKETKKLELRGWMLDVMNCIDKLNKSEFVLQDIYNFENILSQKHPNNKHIRDKIRQQLQLLRNKGYLRFLNNGKYQLI